MIWRIAGAVIALVLIYALGMTAWRGLHPSPEVKVIVAASSDRTSGTRYLYDRRSDAMTKLGEVAPWLPADQMAPMQPIQYTSRDGLTINGYLTLPLGRVPKNLPVIVHPHGGPWHRDTWGIRPGSTVPGQSRVRGSADELPRVHGLWPQVLGSLVR